MRDDVEQAAGTRAAHPAGWPAPSIQKAHERSETFGLQVSARPDYDVLPSSALVLKREQSRVLCVHAMPVMETASVSEKLPPAPVLPWSLLVIVSVAEPL